MTNPKTTTPILAKSAIDKQQSIDGCEFPLAYVSADTGESLAFYLDHISQLKASLLQDLSRHGAILFRGLPLTTDMHFDAFIQAFDLPGFTYAESLSNAVRRNRTERVFTANEAPPDVAIYLHHEMAQTPRFPSALFFFCEQAASTGGATPLCRSDLLLTNIEQRLPDFVRACENKGVRYTNTMPAQEDLGSGQGRSWHSTLNATTVEEAETKLRSLGYQWQWQDSGSLKVVTPKLPAVRLASDGRRVFFNQLIAAFRGWQDSRNEAGKSISFGDGSPIDVDTMSGVIELADELTFDLCWHSGDVALVDNFLVMHGRRPYTGQRRVLASLVA